MLEIVSYFFLSYTKNPLYRARRVLRYDESIGWIQKPLLDTKFEKENLQTDESGFRTTDKTESTKKYKLLTLGPSSALGWGVSYDSTYSSIVSNNLKIDHLNASGIGHSILQGELVWNKKISVKNLELSHALIAYGVNDLDKFRFFDSAPVSDKLFFQSTPLAQQIDKLKLPYNLPVLLSLVTREVLYLGKCDQLAGSAQRVPWNDFELTLTKMINSMKSKNIKPVIVNTPFYLKNKNPQFSQDLIINSYKKVTALANSGKCNEAREELQLAKSYEPDNILDQVLLFNEKLKEFSLKNNLIYVDAFAILSSAPVEQNFVDPVHPSALGHQKIASQIIQLMMY